MPLCLAFEDNRPRASNLHGRSSEQVNLTDNYSAGVATCEATPRIAISRTSVEVRHTPSRAPQPQASRCKHPATSCHWTASDPGGYAAYDGCQRPSARRSLTARADPVTADDRVTNPPGWCCHRLDVVPPTGRSTRLRDRSPGRLGVATGTADCAATSLTAQFSD